MNILIVDDQVDVVEGLISGIDWVQIGIDGIYSANNAYDAKAILRQNMIQILLTDIEMPMQSGIDLSKWVMSKFPDTKCIFLSSHAEFSYAQEALQLGSFDYIVQPAKYEEIASSISRAMEKINEEQQIQKVYQYGTFWQRNEELMLNNYMRTFILDEAGHTNQLSSDLSSLGIIVSENTAIRPVLIQLMEKNNLLSEWDMSSLKYALKNFILEIFPPFKDSIIFVQLDRFVYLALIYSDDEKNFANENIEQYLEIFIGVCVKHLECGCACYIDDICTLDNLRQTYDKLCQIKQNNVAGYSEIYNGVQPVFDYSFPDMEHWSNLIALGSAKLVRQQVHTYLKREKSCGRMSASLLAKFHQNFILMFFNALKSQDKDSKDIFFSEYPFEDYIQAYTSLDKMLELVDFALSYIGGKVVSISDNQSPVDKVIAYIDAHIEQDINRAGLAESIFLNPEYLSRLFKKEVGISLTDFIIKRKMEIAQSLLCNTNIPIYIVASKVGYSNFSYFSQVFKKSCGLTPQEYRQNNTSKSNVI